MVKCYHPCIFATESKTENDMMKKCFNWMLTAALVCGLGLSFTACSDDDDDNNGAVDEREQSVVNGLVSNDETLLGSLLQAWVPDFTAADIVPGILDKTFVADVGEADEANATVRTMVMGTQDAADEYAVNALGSLGINPQQPVGFTWTNPNIGTVSYGTGSGNELGVIRVGVTQLPGLSTIRLVKDFEENYIEQPYYSKGDIVKYAKDGKYYICLNDHTKDAFATWISFDCGDDVKSLSTGTCNWMGTGKDIVYNKAQANAQSIVWWLKSFVVNKGIYEGVLEHMGSLPKSAINQIVPSSNDMRMDLLNALKFDKSTIVLDVNAPILGETKLRATDFYSYSDETKSNKVTRTVSPTGLLLADVMRWSMGFTYDYWVPYLVLIKASEATSFQTNVLDKVSSQFKDEGHFKYQSYESVNIDGVTYYTYVVAMHWTHEEFKDGGTTYKHLMNFTQNLREMQGRVINLNSDEDLDWRLHNITSRQMDVKDNGKENTKFETVYRAVEHIQFIDEDDDF